MFDSKMVHQVCFQTKTDLDISFTQCKKDNKISKIDHKLKAVYLASVGLFNFKITHGLNFIYQYL